MIKTFRESLADGGMTTIRLGTNNGMTGYRIKKFQLFAVTPNVNQESLVMIFNQPQTAAATEADFDNGEVLGAALYVSKESNLTTDIDVVFDNVTFNQDIYLTHTEGEATRGINFYLELEQIKLDLSEATVATLKDMRGSN